MIASPDETYPLTEPSDVVDAWNDAVLYIDSAGVIVGTKGVAPKSLVSSPSVGAFLGEALGLAARNLSILLAHYPPLQIHEIPGREGYSLLLRIIPVVDTLAPCGGYVVILTDNRPMEELYETYEERLEDNIEALSDSITLFNAFFDYAADAMFLLDEAGVILAANTEALNRHATTERQLAGESCSVLLGKRYQLPLMNALKVCTSKKPWISKVVALDNESEGYPAEVSVRKIQFADYALFQLIIQDLTSHVEMEEELQEKEIALRHVIRSVEEDRREMQEQLTDQVKKQMLPVLEKMSTTEEATVRESYKRVIEDQLVDMAGGPSAEFDAELLTLSPREIEVCQLIQLGRSGKDIALHLNLAFETIQTHRKNIRKKLGLRGTKQTLYSYLRQKSSLS